MSRRNSNIDGFVPRRSINNGTGGANNRRAESRILSSRSKSQQQKIGGGIVHAANNSSRLAKRSDIDESLRNIDSNQTPKKGLTRKQRRLMRKMSKKPVSKRRKIIKRIIILLIVVILGLAGFLAYKLINASNKSLTGNIFSALTNTRLKEDSNGRSNFLILGTSEDDAGHDGADLTDSMMVVSVDQDNHDVFIFNVPRDLYVEYGEACSSGYAGKINAYFSCSDDGTSAEAEQNRLTKTQELVGNILGMKIQYGVHINHTVIKDVVDAIGGVDVDVEGSNGDSGVLDRNFDWRCNYTCYYVKYDNGVHHLDGLHALYLSMARGDTAPTYGLGNSNFDREVNQQKIAIAIKKKATSAGVLTDITKVTKIIDALGDNLRTNLNAGELKTLISVMADTKTSNFKQLTFYDSSNQLVKSASYDGQSVVMPSAGIYDYDDIQAYLKKNLSSDKVVREAAPILVLNGTSTSGLASTKANELEDDGFTIYGTDNAPDGSYDKVEIYQIGSGNTATAAKLKKLYGVKIKTSTPPVDVDDDVKFVIIFGQSDD